MMYLVYSLAVLLIGLLHIFVVFNFTRYRYKGDKTTGIIGIFTLFFVLDVLFTLAILIHTPTVVTPLFP